MPQDKDSVTYFTDLVKFVRDKDDGTTFGRERAQRGKELLCLRWGEDGGRLVQDQNARVAIESLEYLDLLLVAYRQGPYSDRKSVV